MQLPASFYLVRHARPLIAPGICYGQLDVPADEVHTLEVAHSLARAMPKGLAVAYSPLSRCEQLVHALQGLRPDLTSITADTRLMEMHFGAWEGRAWDAIGEAAVQAWTDDFAHYRAGQPDICGESVALFMARVSAAFSEASQAPGVLWITHAGVIRAVDLLARGITQVKQASDWPLAAPGYGQWRCAALSCITPSPSGEGRDGG